MSGIDRASANTGAATSVHEALTACLDGFNLTLPRGSGIATFSRSLLATWSSLGLRTQVLHGPNVEVGQSLLMDEIALIEGSVPNKKLTKRQRQLLALRAIFGLSARPVLRSGRVRDTRSDSSLLESNDHWISRDVFATSHRSFHRYGNIIRVSFKPSAETPGPDFVQWTSTMPIVARNKLNLHTVHDIIPIVLPSTTLETKIDYIRLLKLLAERTDHFVAVSETTKRDLVEVVGVDEARITNTYQSVSFPEPPGGLHQSANLVEEAFGLGWKQYFLHYGTIEPKKNLGRLVEAYLRSGSTTPLVVVGSAGWLDEPETALLRALNESATASGRIRRYEYLPRGILEDLVRGAKATLFPSLYEGFGLPVLESMLAGTAVLTSTAGSLPEIAGGAAMLVNPFDVAEISRGIIALDNDLSLRDEIVGLGRERAKFFSPARYEERVRGLLKQVGLTVPAS